MATIPKCFKAYDIRGKVPEELNENMVERIALAFMEKFTLRKVVVGRDMRLTSPGFAKIMIKAFVENGVDVLDLGLCGTEEVYFAVFDGEKDGVDGGVMITASHNPAEYNGMKFVHRGARPVSGDNGLFEIADNVIDDQWFASIKEKKSPVGKPLPYKGKQGYIDHLLSLIDVDSMKPLKIIANPGNGCAGPIIDLLQQKLPFSFVMINEEPDGTFPNGVPNPLLPEKRVVTAEAVRRHGADLGIAWDGDFDRCFFYDETGRFIEGYYIVGLLGAAILKQTPGASILHDPRLTWNTIEIAGESGGEPVMSKTGHSFIKEKMRECDAVYGGEMSAHHYFRDFGYCDSGMIPWLLVCELISKSGKTLSSMVDDRMEKFPVSGEINSTVDDPDAVLERVQKKYSDGELEYTDGISVSYPTYRFNIRKSNTEPVLRLNVETRGNPVLLKEKTNELLELINS